MRAEDAQKLATSTLDELAAALERGQSAQLKAFLAAAARFHSYSFRNVMLIDLTLRLGWSAVEQLRVVRHHLR